MEYADKKWAIDFDILHHKNDADYCHTDLTWDKLEAYTDKLREAMTANDNAAVVDLQDNLIGVFGDDGGDNDTLWKLVDELCNHGCWYEECDWDYIVNH